MLTFMIFLKNSRSSFVTCSMFVLFRKYSSKYQYLYFLCLLFNRGQTFYQSLVTSCLVTSCFLIVTSFKFTFHQLLVFTSSIFRFLGLASQGKGTPLTKSCDALITDFVTIENRYITTCAMLMATKVTRVIKMPMIKKDSRLVTMPRNTKIATMVTYTKGIPLIKSSQTLVKRLSEK